MNVRAPNRVTRSYTQKLAASSAEVFPLLCPVREAEWIDGWSPSAVFSCSGVAEADCVFITPGDPVPVIWYITAHEAASGSVEMIRIAPDLTACRVSIRLRDTEEGCDAQVTYSHTSLGSAGDAFVLAFTEAYFERFMRAWEARLNHFLTHGSMLREAE